MTRARRVPWGRIALLGGTAIVLAAAAVAWTGLRRPLPPRSGTIRLRGLGGPAEVRLDAIGVPHVRAETEEDAVRVLGWLHAADRLFQMEIRRRAAAGRVAEIVGAGAIPLDLEARRLGHDRLARAGLEDVSPWFRRELEAYAGGVNAYMASRPRPLELLALGVAPEPWTALDTLRFARFMYSNLSDALSFEERRYETVLRGGAGPLVQLLDLVHDTPTILPPTPPYRPATPILPADAPEPGGSGSNAWALSGSRTASGRPILATDPHLPVEMPGVWYAAHLTSRDGLDAAGLTLAGSPDVVIGHNGRLAWGITMHQVDDADLFLEALDDEDRRYLDGERWRALELREERVRVRGRGEEALWIRETRHGPLLDGSGAREGAAARLVPAVSWAPAMTAGSFETFDVAERAGDQADLEGAWARYLGPAVNVCWATADGHIGVLAAGAVPRRRAGDGRLPVPGWTGEFDWEGLLPCEVLPRVADPPEGFVASANDDWRAGGFRLPYPGHFAGRERVDRIRQVLSALDGAKVEDMQALQGDVLSLYVARVVRALGKLVLDDAIALRAREVLERWDGRVERLGPARLFHQFVSDLRERTIGPRERRLGGPLPAGWEALARMIEGTPGTDLWDDPGTRETETREGLVAASLHSALERVEAEGGRDPARWSWARVHALRYRHVLLNGTRIPGAGRWLEAAPVELPGDVHTVAVAAHSLASGRFDVRHIASARLIVDLGDPDASRIVLPLGQSGQIGDPHARDQLRAWSEAHDFPFPFTRAAVDRASVSTLRFVPE